MLMKRNCHKTYCVVHEYDMNLRKVIIIHGILNCE